MIGDDGDALRRAFADCPADQGSPEHPAPELLWDAATGALEPDEVGPIIDHVSACGVCAEAWRLARAMEAPAQAGKHRRRARVWPPAVAALAAAAIALIVWQRGPADPPGPSRYRGGKSELALHIPDGAVLPRHAATLRWDSAGPGARYAVQVTTEALALVAEARSLEHTEWIVPASALAPLGDGTRLLWRVEATLPDGSKRRSPTRAVQVGSR